MLGSSFVGIFAIAILIGILFFVVVRDHENDSRRARTLEVLRVTNKVENDMNNLEADYRGYLVMGEDQYLQSIEPRKGQLFNHLDELNLVVHQDPKARQHVPRIRQAIEQWIAQTVTPGIEAYQKKQSKSPGAILPSEAVRSNLSSPVSDDARKYLQTLEDEEQAEVRTLTKDEQFAGASFEVLVYTPKLESVISEMEKAQWGYLLTGQQASIVNYQNASGEYDVIHGHLAVLLGDNPVQLAALEKINQELDRWRNEAAVPAIQARASAQGRGAPRPPEPRKGHHG